MRALFVQAASLLLNPTLSEETVNASIADDPEAGRSEWLGSFRSDVDSYLSDELIDRSVTRGVRARPWQSGYAYTAFCDMSGGVTDAAALAIACVEAPGRVALCRLVTVDAPFDPDKATEQLAQTLSSFGLQTVIGDRYAAQWTVTTFRRYGIVYRPSELSEIYAEGLPLFSAGMVELLDIPRLHTELRLLERKPRAGGRADSYQHPRGAHDDCAVACVGALLAASKNTLVEGGYIGSNVTHSICGVRGDSLEDRDTQRPAPQLTMTPAGWSANRLNYADDQFNHSERDADPWAHG
jgi:hypothetical protein